MAREVWGTFSVKDHLAVNAFVSDVMLYDRLVIPTPPNDEEYKRWEKEGWRPNDLDRILEILGDRAYKVKWDEARQEKWKTRFEAGDDVSGGTGNWAFVATRVELTQDLPRHVTGVEAVVPYPSVDDLTKELNVEEYQVQIGSFGTTVAAVVGREFLVPNNPNRSYEDLLKEAIDLSSEPAMRHKRAGFWRWHREFVDDKGLTDQLAIKAAIEEMQEMLEEERAFMRKKKVQTTIQYAYVVATVTLGLLGSPLTPISMAGAFLSVGKYRSDKLGKGESAQRRASVALVYDVRKHFGWK